MAKLKVGIISFAHVHAPSHVEQLKSRSEVEIIGAYDDNEERGRYYANVYGLEFYENLESLFKKIPDLVVIDSENVKHLDHVKAAAEKGVHIFCEKPIGSNLRMAVKIKEIVERSGILFTTGFNSRFNPENIAVRDLIASGELGDIYAVRIRVAHSAAIDRWFSGWTGWFASRELAGGGGLLDLGIHGADLLRFILRDEAIEVQGFISNSTRVYDVDDQGIGVIRFSKGTLGVLDAGWAQVVEHMPWSPLEVYGSRGSALRTCIGLMHYSRERRAWVKPVSNAPYARSALDDIVDAVKNGRKPLVTVNEAVKAQEIIEAIYLSELEGRRVKIPLA
ncbi:MAG: Gfo/Idh/MocA family oxidoreductase [Thermofilaceae archaeon]